MARTFGRELGAALALVLAFSARGGFGQESPSGPEKGKTWTAGSELDFNSKYVWRSLAFSEGAVWQPSVWVGTGGLTFQVWANYLLYKEAHYRQFDEVDFRLSDRIAAGDFTLEPAFTVYSYPNQDPRVSPTTGEAEIQIAYSLGDFSLETTHFLDVWSNKGGYAAEIGVQFENKTAGGLTWNAAARLVLTNAKFNSYYILDGAKGGFEALALEAGLTYAHASGVYFRPHVEWNNILDGNLRTAVRISPIVALRKPTLFNIGLAVGYEY